MQKLEGNLYPSSDLTQEMQEDQLHARTEKMLSYLLILSVILSAPPTVTNEPS